MTDPRRFLRLEGLAVLGGSLGVFLAADGSLPLLVVLALAPDLSMLGYLRGPRVGAATYNVVHAYVLPLALGGTGVVLGESLFVQVAAVWTAHIGFDRALGFGLKYDTGFRDTHLGTWTSPSAPDALDR
jgi:hypothetical protein